MFDTEAQLFCGTGAILVIPDFKLTADTQLLVHGTCFDSSIG